MHWAVINICRNWVSQIKTTTRRTLFGYIKFYCRADISGNVIGDIGARLLAKALQINTKLKTIMLDRNNITLQGYSDIVYALENNNVMRNIPFPIFDVAPCLKSHPDRTDALMRKMQEYLQRNSLGLKRVNGQAFRLQHGLMISSTHQLVDKLVSETVETMSLSAGSLHNESAVQRLIDDAENSKQLLPKLQECVRCEPHPIESKLVRVAADISQSIRDYLEVQYECTHILIVLNNLIINIMPIRLPWKVCCNRASNSVRRHWACRVCSVTCAKNAGIASLFQRSF